MRARRKDGWRGAAFWLDSSTSTSSGLLSPPPPPPAMWLVVDGGGGLEYTAWLDRFCSLWMESLGSHLWVGHLRIGNSHHNVLTFYTVTPTINRTSMKGLMEGPVADYRKTILVCFTGSQCNKLHVESMLFCFVLKDLRQWDIMQEMLQVFSERNVLQTYTKSILIPA